MWVRIYVGRKVAGCTKIFYRPNYVNNRLLYA